MKISVPVSLFKQSFIKGAFLFRIKNQLLLALIIYLLSGCCTNKKAYYLPGKVKEYVYFDTGSYWIYQDLNSNRDTVSVVESNLRFGSDGAETCSESEGLSISYSSSYFGDRKASAFANIISEDNCIAASLPWKWSGEMTDLYYKQQSLNETMVINDTTFTEIIVCEARDTTYTDADNYPIRYFLAKDVGIIRKDYHDGSIFKLIDYKIVNP